MRVAVILLEATINEPPAEPNDNEQLCYIKIPPAFGHPPFTKGG